MRAFLITLFLLSPLTNCQAQACANPTVATTVATVQPQDQADAAKERRLKRQIVRGVIKSDATLRDKLSILRAMRDDGTYAKIRELVVVGAQAADIDVYATEFPWQDFFEFLKWLIPLIIELIGEL